MLSYIIVVCCIIAGILKILFGGQEYHKAYTHTGKSGTALGWKPGKDASIPWIQKAIRRAASRLLRHARVNNILRRLKKRGG